MSTNADRPFAPGERVQWKQYVATVVSNEGESGMVEIDGYQQGRWWWVDDGRDVVRREVPA